MAIIGDALGQTFIPKREHNHLQQHQNPNFGPIILTLALTLALAIVIAVCVSLSIIFPGESNLRPLCRDRRIHALKMAMNVSVDASDSYHVGAFYLTDEEAAEYYWMLVFVPSAFVFLVSAVYLLSGMVVACSTSARHPCLKVVENSYCASRRGGVRCLSILNTVFAVVFGLMAIFLGSSLLTLGSSCSIPLFWCYETASWGLVILYGFTAFILRRKASGNLDESEFLSRDLGLEMSESIVEVTPEMQRCVHEGFKSWMGSDLVSSDEENGPDDYLEGGHPILDSNYQRKVSR